MNEDIEQLVPHRDRFAQTYTLARESGSTITGLLEYFAEQVKMAYIAGANRVHIAEARPKEIITSGEIYVDAVNYVKDKGYQI